MHPWQINTSLVIIVEFSKLGRQSNTFQKLSHGCTDLMCEKANEDHKSNNVAYFTEAECMHSAVIDNFRRVENIGDIYFESKLY